jgi:hypothetical protein
VDPIRSRIILFFFLKKKTGKEKEETATPVLGFGSFSLIDRQSINPKPPKLPIFLSFFLFNFFIE